MGENSINGLLRDSFSLTERKGASFGVCRLASKLLKKVQNNPSLVSQNELLHYRDVLLLHGNEQSIMLSAKCLARISIITQTPLDIDTRTMATTQLSVFSISYPFFSRIFFDISLSKPISCNHLILAFLISGEIKVFDDISAESFSSSSASSGIEIFIVLCALHWNIGGFVILRSVSVNSGEIKVFL